MLRGKDKNKTKKQNQKEKKGKAKAKIVISFDCYRCKKLVQLTKQDNQPGKLYDIFWINDIESYQKICPSCTLNMDEFLDEKPLYKKIMDGIHPSIHPSIHP